MKKILLFIAILGSILAGCSDFLEEDNKSYADADEYYATADGYEALINACYSSLRSTYGDEPWMFCAGTDMYVEGRDGQPVGLSEYEALDAGEEEDTLIYNTCYRTIKNCNLALYYNDKTEETSSLSTRKGEALYMRANANFLLVQSYGGVAIVTDVLTEPVLSYTRASASDMYDLIISDLETAEDLVSDEAFSGRVTKRAVQHLLAKVYLTRGYQDFGESGDFSKAAQYADAAINGEGLTNSFGDLWIPGSGINSEVLFSVQYDESSISVDPEQYGNMQAFYFGPYMGGSENAGYCPYRSYTLCPTSYLLSLFEEGDERWEATFMTDIYYGYDDEGAQVIDYFSVYNDDMLTIAHRYAPKWASTEDDETAFLAANPDGTFHYFEDLEASKSSNLDFETIAIRKFDDPTAVFDEHTSTRDIVLARLGETYLVAAEAYLKAGDEPTALARLNVVRERAKASTLSAIDIDVILDERAMELAGEYHRWFDLKRTGTLISRCVDYNHDIPDADVFGENGYKTLRPIPQEALDLNQGDYSQNPGY